MWKWSGSLRKGSRRPQLKPSLGVVPKATSFPTPVPGAAGGPAVVGGWLLGWSVVDFSHSLRQNLPCTCLLPRPVWVWSPTDWGPSPHRWNGGAGGREQVYNTAHALSSVGIKRNSQSEMDYSLQNFLENSFCIIHHISSENHELINIHLKNNVTFCALELFSFSFFNYDSEGRRA